MAVFHVEHNKGYTVMSNHHLHSKGTDAKGERAIVANAVLAGRLGLHPCRTIP